MKRPALILYALAIAMAVPAAAQTDGDREALAQPVAGLTTAERQRFLRGRSLFRQSWVIAPASDAEVDGLGPLYNRLACISCHAKNGRGGAPAGPDQRMQSMLVRLSVPGRAANGGPRPHPAYGDQLNEEGVPGVPGEGRVRVNWVEEVFRYPDGTTASLRRPRWTFAELAYGPLGRTLFSPRVSPHVAGLGLLESVPDGVLEELAREVKPDGVRGSVNRVWDASAGRAAIGRFGLKANTPNVRQQTAGAFVGDMGITSPPFPGENCTAKQTACRRAASGGHPELSAEQLDDVDFYVSHLAPPARRRLEQPPVQAGERLFSEAGCAVCHRPSLPGGDHPRFPRLSRRSVEPYSDLLLHDLGDALADGRPDFKADGRQWRTAPLWGLGVLAAINEGTGFLHDGRARTPEEAILWHGGEATVARRRFVQLSKSERESLLAFLMSL